MNLMYAALNNVMSKNPKINVKIKQLQQKIKDEHIKFTDNFKKMRGLIYFDEGLPIIGKCRDVLKKPEDICTLHMSFDRKEDLSKVSVEDALKRFTTKYAWCIHTVDADHKRNKYKNKTIAWVMFDSLEEAEKAKEQFNSMFITALEWDTIEEYRRFKENPEKRPLTFDQQGPNAYELYEAVDNGEI